MAAYHAIPIDFDEYFSSSPATESLLPSNEGDRGDRKKLMVLGGLLCTLALLLGIGIPILNHKKHHQHNHGMMNDFENYGSDMNVVWMDPENEAHHEILRDDDVTTSEDFLDMTDDDAGSEEEKERVNDEVDLENEWSEDDENFVTREESDDLFKNELEESSVEAVEHEPDRDEFLSEDFYNEDDKLASEDMDDDAFEEELKEDLYEEYP